MTKKTAIAKINKKSGKTPAKNAKTPPVKEQIKEKKQSRVTKSPAASAKPNPAKTTLKSKKVGRKSVVVKKTATNIIS